MCQAPKLSKTPAAAVAGNPILGTVLVIRVALQYFVVGVGVYFLWKRVIPTLALGVVSNGELLFLYAMAVVMVLLPFCVGLPPSPGDFTNDEAFLDEIGVVIPCHKSADEIGAVLRGCLQYFRPDHIIVVDNANSKAPPDDTENVVREVSSKIRYLYIPQGFKTRALFHGTKLLPETVKYVLHLDDDTLLSESMVFDKAHFDDPKVSGVTFGIRMAGTSLTSRCVDWEFILFSVRRTFRAMLATAFFCHGIVGLWRRDRWTRLLETHAAMPYGEDAWIGCDALSSNLRIAGELRCWVSTYAPSRLTPFDCRSKQRQQGYGASSIWKQRALRWYTNAPRRLLIRFAQFLHYDAGAISKNFFFRVFLLLHIHRVAFYLVTPLVVAYALLVKSPTAVAKTFLFWTTAITLHRVKRNVFIACFIFRKDKNLLSPGLFTIIFAYPIYALFLDACFVYGHWRSLLYYIPFFPLQRHLPREWVKSHAAILKHNSQPTAPRVDVLLNGRKSGFVERNALRSNV